MITNNQLIQYVAETLFENTKYKKEHCDFKMEIILMFIQIGRFVLAQKGISELNFAKSLFFLQ